MAGGGKKRSKSIVIKRSGRANPASPDAAGQPEAVADTNGNTGAAQEHFAAEPQDAAAPEISEEAPAPFGEVDEAAAAMIESADSVPAPSRQPRQQVQQFQPVPLAGIEPSPELQSKQAAKPKPQSQPQRRQQAQPVPEEAAAAAAPQPAKKRISTRLVVIAILIPALCAGLIYRLKHKELEDITEPTLAVVPYLDPAYAYNTDENLIRHIGGYRDENWGRYVQPEIPWYEKMFCRGYQKSWFCPEKDRHPFLESYKFYGIEVEEEKYTEKYTNTFKR